ncbi:hypothetical protein [Pseudomonas phage U5]|nr:hypothetical protein [Pseudomonas phage U5]
MLDVRVQKFATTLSVGIIQENCGLATYLSWVFSLAVL